tara:strand:+ start:10068 stop:10823 length:756 start_codon:yes stop_codon:yes gene_type:complete
MKNLKFPEISKKIQQSVFGAYGGAYSDDFWCDGGMGGQLDPVYITNNPTYDWGDTFGGEQNDYGDADGYSGSSGSSDGGAEQVEGWGNSEFLAYYEGGDGVPVSLHQIGHFETIRNSTEFTELMERVNDQIEVKIQEYIDDGQGASETIEYDFLNSYDFTSDVFAIGSAYVSGVLSNLRFFTTASGSIGWGGDIYLTFHDVFEDPLDLIDVVPGTFDYADPYIINESWTENIGGHMIGAAGDGQYEYGYGY